MGDELEELVETWRELADVCRENGHTKDKGKAFAYDRAADKLEELIDDENTIELDDRQLDIVTDVLDNAQEQAVTDRERAHIRDVHREIVEQWAADE